MRKLNNILVTGGAGFIGCNFIHLLLQKTPSFSGRIVNFDALTYAGNLANLTDIDLEFGGYRYFLEHGDICNRRFTEVLFAKYDIDTVVHFAAESHVDRSIFCPEIFVKTDVLGTLALLDTARNVWKNADGSMRSDVLFHHISTDEVFGSLNNTGYFTEKTAYRPHSPYSASKAASDHLVFAYHHTYEIPVTLSNCSNNYGPYQFPEKFIPLMILNTLEKKPLPIYGSGKNIRDWLYVEDHNRAVWLVMNKGESGSTYNIGGENEWENIALLYKLIEIVSERVGLDRDSVLGAIAYVKDRSGHDWRYAIDCTKIKNELDWKQSVDFEKGLSLTVDWYLSHTEWIENIRSGEYTRWLKRNYGSRRYHQRDSMTDAARESRGEPHTT